LGAGGRIGGKVLSGDEFPLGCARTPEEILRVVYGSGNESIPGGFYQKGELMVALLNLICNQLPNALLAITETAGLDFMMRATSIKLALHIVYAQYFQKKY
jgi:hypothetical protein